MRESIRQIIGLLASNILLLLTFQLGLGFQKSGIKHLTQNRILGRAFLLTLLIVPMIAILIVKVLPVPAIGSGIIVLLAICPGVPFMVTGPQRNYVSRSTSIAFSMFLTLAAVLMLPLWLLLLQRAFSTSLSVDLAEVVTTLLTKVFVPFAMGWALSSIAPNIASKTGSIVGMVFKIALGAVIVALAIISLPAWSQLSIWSLLAMFLVIGLSAWAGDSLGRPELGDRTLLASAAMNGNPAIALAIIHSSFPEMQVAPGLAIYLILRVLASKPYSLWIENQHDTRQTIASAVVR